MSEENTEKTKPAESKTVTKTPKKASAKKSTKKADPQDDFLTNFNWHQYKEGIDELDEKQIKEFEKLVEKNFVDTSDDNIILGEVIHMTEKDVIIESHINGQSEFDIGARRIENDKYAKKYYNETFNTNSNNSCYVP